MGSFVKRGSVRTFIAAMNLKRRIRQEDDAMMWLDGFLPPEAGPGRSESPYSGVRSLPEDNPGTDRDLAQIDHLLSLVIGVIVAAVAAAMIVASLS